MQRAYQKIRNMRKYYIHEITTDIVTSNDVIVTEKLKVKDMIENKTNHLSKHITNASFSEIIRQLKYKTEWANKKMYQVDTYYPSSKLCNHCKDKNNELNDLSIRQWECKKCKNKNDRDINASLNILEEGIRKYYKELYSN